MTPSQRYFFDVAGYLHIKNALTEKELSDGRLACERYMKLEDNQFSDGFGKDGKRYINGFAFDRSLERLVFHPSIWPVIMELTNGKPKLVSGTLQIDQPGAEGGGLHCARDDYGWESCRYEVKNSRIYCDNFVVFPYFDDVLPGDGGLLLVPGSHKAQFERPRHLFQDGHPSDSTNLPEGIINVTPKAGDILVMPELMTHGILPWQPTDRLRRILVLRYAPQYRGGGGVPESLEGRLLPETQELMSSAHYTHVKTITEIEPNLLQD